MKCAVLGGAGYLGSVISKELSASGCDVNVFDALIFSEEYSGTNKVIEEDVLTSKETYVNGHDITIWCCDIDVPLFYTCEESRKYIQNNIEKFTAMASKGGDRFYWVTGVPELYSLDNPYRQMVMEKFVIMRKCKREHNIMVIPELYGPSIRTRLDTFTNAMFVQAMTEGLIGVGDWLDRYAVNSVGSVGKAIASHILDKKQDKFPFQCMKHSKIEIANMIRKAVSDKVQIITSDNKGGTDHVPDYAVEISVNIQDFSIERSFKYMMDGIERGLVDDILKDSHWNDKVINSYLVSRRFSRFMKM